MHFTLVRQGAVVTAYLDGVEQVLTRTADPKPLTLMEMDFGSSDFILSRLRVSLSGVGSQDAAIQPATPAGEGTVLLNEDFSSLGVGVLPPKWEGGAHSMVKSTPRGKRLQPFERGHNEFKIPLLGVANHDFDLEILLDRLGLENRGCRMDVGVGSETALLVKELYRCPGAKIGGSFVCLDDSEYSEAFGEVLRVGFARRGQVLTVVVNGRELVVYRMAESTAQGTIDDYRWVRVGFGESPFSMKMIRLVAYEAVPAGQDVLSGIAPEDRAVRTLAIASLAKSTDPADAAKLEQIITGDYTSSERGYAIRLLGDKGRESLVPHLKDYVRSTDLVLKSEAAIVLFRWGEKEFAAPILDELPSQGVGLRRAFFLGTKDGEYLYHPEAERFLDKAIKAEQVHVRLDAALGLLHLGKKGIAIPAFEAALNNQESEHARLTAVAFLASARDIPEARSLLDRAAKDPSPNVSKKAKEILSE
jgi:hypothetical protein